jgi:prepilin-type N-terminal cleavage/methylation domain-containing protein
MRRKNLSFRAFSAVLREKSRPEPAGQSNQGLAITAAEEYYRSGRGKTAGQRSSNMTFELHRNRTGQPPLGGSFSFADTGVRHKNVRSGLRRAFSLTELLVSVTIILLLVSLSAAAVSGARSSHRRTATASLLAKLDAIVAPQFVSYAGKTVAAGSAEERGEALRAMAAGDLPDSWTAVAEMAATPDSELTPPQRAYKAVWESVDNKSVVMQENENAECLFMIIMQGGIADCLDCRGLKPDVGDQDGDSMPEFLDAWGSPVGFVLWPSGLELPAGRGERYFSEDLPFDPVMPSADGAKGGLMRPLLVSAGPDRDYGLAADASPLPQSLAARDNITNFDEEAIR